MPDFCFNFWIFWSILPKVKYLMLLVLLRKADTALIKGKITKRSDYTKNTNPDQHETITQKRIRYIECTLITNYW